MEIITGKKTTGLSMVEFRKLLSPYTRVVVDIGTGDGKFTYEYARKRPDSFCIGIDSARENLEKYSAKIYKKPAKGGLPNVLYVIANVEDLPQELAGVADEVWIILPWGSLLQHLIGASPIFLENIRKIAGPQATLHAFVSYELRYEEAEIHKLGLPELTDEYVQRYLAENYRSNGIGVLEATFVENDRIRAIKSTWARRLGYGKTRNTLVLQVQIGSGIKDEIG